MYVVEFVVSKHGGEDQLFDDYESLEKSFEAKVLVVSIYVYIQTDF